VRSYVAAWPGLTAAPQIKARNTSQNIGPVTARHVIAVCDPSRSRPGGPLTPPQEFQRAHELLARGALFAELCVPPTQPLPGAYQPRVQERALNSTAPRPQKDAPKDSEKGKGMARAKEPAPLDRPASNRDRRGEDWPALAPPATAPADRPATNGGSRGQDQPAPGFRATSGNVRLGPAGGPSHAKAEGLRGNTPATRAAPVAQPSNQVFVRANRRVTVDALGTALARFGPLRSVLRRGPAGGFFVEFAGIGAAQAALDESNAEGGVWIDIVVEGDDVRVKAFVEPVRAPTRHTRSGRAGADTLAGPSRASDAEADV
jgi:hypothetical protein